MTDRELLELVLQKVTTIETEVSSLKTDMTEVKSDVATLKTDMTEVKSDMAIVKSNVATLEADMTSVKSELSAVRSEQRSMKQAIIETNERTIRLDEKLSTIAKQVAYLTEREQKIEDITLKVEAHDTDIKLIKRVLISQ